MFERFVEDEQFNFQINRAAAYGPDWFDLAEVRLELPRIRDVESWTRVWLELARRAEAEGRFGPAVYYYRLAEFYLPDTAPEKDACYRKFRSCFDAARYGEDVERLEIPYDGTYLPALRLKAARERAVLVIHGGYDSFIEEFYPLVCGYRDQGYTLILFEGPGQGQARKNGLLFTHEWERPTSAVLDYLGLNHVALLGISWGGYLALRAAAFDKRIERVVCYDIFYWGMDAILNGLPRPGGWALRALLRLRCAPLLNSILARKMARSTDLSWKLTHGMYITGTRTPYEFLSAIARHRLADCAGLVSQDVLLLAGAEDQYVPVRRMRDVKAGLVHARTVTSRVFTRAEGGEQHCQIGNVLLALDEIDRFLARVYPSPPT